MPSLLLLLFFIFAAPTLLSATPRRVLHQPFFPLLSIPSPTPSDDSAPPSPPRPFFPVYPSPPPPPPPLPSFPTVPANLSAAGAAGTGTGAASPPHRSSRLRLAPLIALPAAALAVLLLTLAFLLVSRSRPAAGGDAAGSDSCRFFPPNSTASDGRKLSTGPSAASPPAAAAAPSDFLYLGTLVSSRAPAAEASGSPPYQKLSSPELRPLPPLARHGRHARCYSSDDEFYSPSGIGSPVEDRSPPKESASPVSTPSTPSRRSSNVASSPSPSSSPRISSSPGMSGAKQSGFVPPPPLAPPRMLRPMTPSPPRMLRPMTPSPPKRRPFVMNAPPPAPPRPPVILPRAAEKPKLKPLHWDKVHASSDGTMVWDRLRSSSFELNEEMISELFVYGGKSVASKDASKRQFKSSPCEASRVLDPKKSQNIAILLRALNVTKEEVCGALLEGNADSLSNELLETLLKMTPSKEEECQLKEYKDDSPFKLGPAEKFLKAVVDIPFAFKRVDAMLYIANFEPDVNYLWNSFGTLEAACDELRSSRLFLKLLEAVLKTGNRMNVGTNRGDAEAFKLDTLLKLVDVKGADGKTTLLHFVVQEITKAEGLKTNGSALKEDLECRKLGLQVVSRLGSELNNVKKAASMDSDVLSCYVAKLASGIEKISEVQSLNTELSSNERSQPFHDAMSGFLMRAEGEMIKLQDKERTSMSRVKELTMYFQGYTTKEEGHPLRTFMVVRDFLGILDKVCKEVERINERTAVSTIYQVPAPANSDQVLVFPKLNTTRSESSDDESSSSSMI